MPASTDHHRPFDLRAELPDHAAQFARWSEASRAVREQLRCEADYYYGSAPTETLDFFPASHANAPLFIFIPGMAWWDCDKSDFAFIAPPFIEAGISLAVLNHGPAAHSDYAEIIRQMLRACVWLWHNAPDLGADPARMFIGGHAAGAHLAAILLAAQWSAHAPGLPDHLLRGGVCISGLYDLAAIAPVNIAGWPHDTAAARHVSPTNYLPPRAQTLITAVGSQENEEFQRQNCLLGQTWPHCATRHLRIADHHHLSLLATLGEGSSELFQAARRLILA